MFKLKKDEFEKIELCFDIMKDSPHNPKLEENIAKSLESCFDYKFIVKVIQNTSNELFVMSVFPETSTMDKIVMELMKEGDSSNVVKSLWEKNKVWNIEIDEKIFDKSIIDLDKRELTACLLHEVGHVIFSNAITERISTIMKYEIAKSPMTVKALGKDSIFRKILSLPILNACVGNRDHSSLKEEVKADKFVIKMGYEKDLVSVLNKMIKCNNYPKNGSTESDMAKVTNFSTKTLDDFQSRKAAIVKKSLLGIKESVSSEYIKDFITEYVNTIYIVESNQPYFTEEVKIDLMKKRADESYEKYVSEFFIFKKTLEKISPEWLDYARMKVNSIETELQRMMIVSYIHSKLDMINYYISILESPKYSKLYNVPHSVESLYAMKKQYEELKERAINYRLQKQAHFYVTYPDGYEG